MKKLSLIWALLAALSLNTAALAQSEEAPKADTPPAEETQPAEGADGEKKKKEGEEEPDC